MFNMIKADLYRMSKNKGMILFFIFIIIDYSISLFAKMPGGLSFGMPAVFGENAKLDVRMMGMNFTWFYLLIMPVFVIITADFGEKTIKNTISSAISRKKYYAVKVVFAEIVTVVSFLGANVLFYILNSVINGEDYSSEFSVFFRIVILQLPIFMAVTAVLTLVAFWVKRIAAYNSITIITPIVYTLIALTMYNIKTTQKLAEDFLLKYEVGYMLNQIAADCGKTYLGQCIVGSSVMGVLALIAGYMLFTKRELD